jgi:hypothetical protein
MGGSETKVKDLYPSVRAQEDVGRLDVPVDHTLVMRRADPVGCRNADLLHPPPGQRAALRL